MIQFGRKYRMIVSSGKTGIEVTDLHCKFDIKKQWAQQPNMSTLTIYNLSANTENQIIKSADGLIIEAGYDGGPYGEIFRGNIVQFVRGKEDSTTYYLKIIALDGDNFFNFGTVAFNLNRGVGLRNQIDQIANKSSVAVKVGDVTGATNTQKLARGKVFFGAAKDYLRDIGKSTNSVFGVESEAITMQSATGKPVGSAIELNAETGLVGFPTQNDQGVSCKALLNPQMVIGGLVKLTNSVINQAEISLGKFLRPLPADGVYRIITLNHKGDTRGQDWYTDIGGITQGEALIPGLMPGASSNPW